MSDAVGLWIYFIGCALIMVVGLTLATLDSRVRGRDFVADRALDMWAVGTTLTAICWPGLFLLALCFCVVAGVSWLGFTGFGLLMTLMDKLVLTPLARPKPKTETKKGGSNV